MCYHCVLFLAIQWALLENNGKSQTPLECRLELRPLPLLCSGSIISRRASANHAKLRDHLTILVRAIFRLFYVKYLDT